MIRIRTGSIAVAGFFLIPTLASVLPQEITHLRERLGWSMSRLARELGTDPDLVVDWESGQQFPTRKHHETLLGLERTLLEGRDESVLRHLLR